MCYKIILLISIMVHFSILCKHPGFKKINIIIGSGNLAISGLSHKQELKVAETGSKTMETAIFGKFKHPRR